MRTRRVARDTDDTRTRRGHTRLTLPMVVRTTMTCARRGRAGMLSRRDSRASGPRHFRPPSRCWCTPMYYNRPQTSRRRASIERARVPRRELIESVTRRLAHRQGTGRFTV